MKRKTTGFIIAALMIGVISGAYITHWYEDVGFWKNLSSQYKNEYNKLTNYRCTQADVKAFLKDFGATSSGWNLTGTASLACRGAFTAYQQYELTLPTPTPATSPQKTSNLIPLSSIINTNYPNCQVALNNLIRVGYSLSGIKAYLQNNLPICLP